MRLIFGFLFFATINLFAQQKFLIDASYGVAFINEHGKEEAGVLPPNNTVGNLWFNTKDVGQAFNLNIEYKVFRNSYLGIGYLSEFFRTKTNQQLGNIVQKEFYNSKYLQAYDVHYSKYFKHLSLTGGVFWYNEQGNYAHFTNDYETLELEGEAWNRSDNLGVFAAVGYQYPIYEYLSVGIKAKGYFCIFEGFTTATLAPYISFKF